LALVSNRAMAGLRGKAVGSESAVSNNSEAENATGNQAVANSDAGNKPGDKNAAAAALAGKNPEEIQKEIAALQKQLVSLEGFLKKSYLEADKTKETVMKASEVAAKTPAILAERSKAEQKASKELAEAEAERKRQEVALANQKKLVDELKQKFIKAVPKREK